MSIDGTIYSMVTMDEIKRRLNLKQVQGGTNLDIIMKADTELTLKNKSQKLEDEKPKLFSPNF